MHLLEFAPEIMYLLKYEQGRWTSGRQEIGHSIGKRTVLWKVIFWKKKSIISYGQSWKKQRISFKISGIFLYAIRNFLGMHTKRSQAAKGNVEGNF